jgi:hypothetical protein
VEDQASLTGGGSHAATTRAYASTAKASSSRPGKGWATDLQSKGGWAAELATSKAPVAWPELNGTKGGRSSGPRKRGRRPGKRVPDEAVLPSIARLVGAAGKEGVSARKVSQATGIFYPRVVKLMDQNFKKTGERKWSRYHLK